MPKPPSEDPAITDSYSMRQKHIDMVDQLTGWMNTDKSTVVRYAVECLYAQEAAKQAAAKE